MKIFSKSFFKQFVFTSISLAVLSACSTQEIQTRDRLDYKAAVETNTLELPPDLVGNANTRTNATSLRDYYQKANQTAESRVLVNKTNARIMGTGDNIHLAVSANADDVWRSLVAVFRDAGLQAQISNAEAGLFETKWAENRADIPDGFLRKTITKAGVGFLYSAATRDMYKARLERNGDQVLVYITHYGMKDKTSGRDGEFHTWVDRPSDPQLSGALLNRLLVKLGGVVEERTASGTAQRTTITPSTQNDSIEINRSIQTVWTQVGNILDDGAQFKVEQQDTASNTFVIAWRDPAKEKSALKKLAFWSDDTLAQRFKVSLTALQNNATEVSVTELGNANSTDTHFIISKLKEQLI